MTHCADCGVWLPDCVYYTCSRVTATGDDVCPGCWKKKYNDAGYRYLVELP